MRPSLRAPSPRSRGGRRDQDHQAERLQGQIRLPGGCRAAGACVGAAGRPAPPSRPASPLPPRLLTRDLSPPPPSILHSLSDVLPQGLHLRVPHGCGGAGGKGAAVRGPTQPAPQQRAPQPTPGGAHPPAQPLPTPPSSPLPAPRFHTQRSSRSATARASLRSWGARSSRRRPTPRSATWRGSRRPAPAAGWATCRSPSLQTPPRRSPRGWARLRGLGAHGDRSVGRRACRWVHAPRQWPTQPARALPARPLARRPQYGVLLERAGIALRGLFLINPQGIIQQVGAPGVGAGDTVDGSGLHAAGGDVNAG
jgi:hypothetical protein